MFTGGDLDLHGWLSRMAEQPLPGGVAAGAVAAAMGAALIVKSLRITLARQSLADEEHAQLVADASLAREQGAELVRLAAADERAYQAVLATRGETAQSETWRQARWRATEIPIQVAEACKVLLERVPSLLNICWPAVCADQKIGGWLLETGVRAGLQAAESNLLAWGEDGKLESLRTRIDLLLDQE